MMPFLEEMAGAMASPCVDWQRCLSSGSTTEDEEYGSCVEEPQGEMDHRPNGREEDSTSLYAELRRCADGTVLDFCSVRQQQAVGRGRDFTLAVMFLFEHGASRKACWRVLRDILRVSADIWWSLRDEVSLLLLLSLETPLSGVYTAARLDRYLASFLGCSCGLFGRADLMLRHVRRISYEVVPVDSRDDWVAKRDDVLRPCRNWFLSDSNGM